MQPDGAPPEQWEKRRDHDTRALVDILSRHLKAELDAMNKKLDAAQDKLITLEAKQESNVTWRGALGGFALMVVTFASAGWALVTDSRAVAQDAGVKAEAKAQQAMEKVEAVERFLKTDLQDFRRELNSNMSDVKAEIRNSNRTEERKPRRRRAADAGDPVSIDGGGSKAGP